MRQPTTAAARETALVRLGRAMERLASATRRASRAAMARDDRARDVLRVVARARRARAAARARARTALRRSARARAAMVRARERMDGLYARVRGIPEEDSVYAAARDALARRRERALDARAARDAEGIPPPSVGPAIGA